MRLITCAIFAASLGLALGGCIVSDIKCYKDSSGERVLPYEGELL